LVLFVCAACLRLSASFVIERLDLPGSSFDPEDPAVQSLLLQAGVNFSHIARLTENMGLNSGVWSLADGGDGEMIMKLRQPATEVPFIPEEVHHLSNLLEEYPSLSSDPGIVVPSVVFECRGADGAMLGHLIVMRRAPGKTLAMILNEMLYLQAIGEVADAWRELAPIFEGVGRHLASFHVRYGGRQHNDFQGSNILVDIADGSRVTFIDLGLMGVPIKASDLRHFEKAARSLAAVYPPGSFFEECFPAFEKGYYEQIARETCLAPSTAGSFRVALPLVAGHDLGLELAERDGSMFVAAVGAGAVAGWNEYTPGPRVQVGQRIAAVNARAVSPDNVQDILREVHRELGKGDEVDVWSSSEKKWVAHGKIVTLSQWAVEVELQDQSVTSANSRASYPLFEVFRSDQGFFEVLVDMSPIDSDNITFDVTL